MTLNQLLSKIAASEKLHAKWLNTLSFLENCGARKISACEHPTLVKEEMLKHASEEFRHAHYLKSQITRISTHPLKDYSLPNMLGGFATLHYLSALDLKASRYLLKTQCQNIIEAAYLLVTYAIELRAEKLYPAYDTILRKLHSKVTVKSILLEEKEHLDEMRKGIRKLPSGEAYAKHICTLEDALYNKWLFALNQDIHKKSPE